MAGNMKLKQELRGWQLIIIAVALYLIGSFIGGVLGDIMIVVSPLFLLLSIPAFVRESRSKK